MSRDGFTLVSLGAVLCGGLLVSSLRAAAPDQQPSGTNELTDKTVQIEDVHPFTHLAYIPAGSDLSTIIFEKANKVEVYTKRRYTLHTDYCSDLAFRDPGGSMFCPSIETEEPTTAFQVTYSFRGQPLASDEYGHTHFTFQVYFRPDELPPVVRESLATRKLSRAEAASYFAVKTSREPEQRVVIDEARSNFCDTVLLDGCWSQVDPDCRETIHFKTITTPSDYIAVRVDPVLPH